MTDDRDEVFTIQVRRCKRCGGLLTSAQSIKDGYGHACKRQIRMEELAKEIAKDQISLFEEEANE